MTEGMKPGPEEMDRLYDEASGEDDKRQWYLETFEAARQAARAVQRESEKPREQQSLDVIEANRIAAQKLVGAKSYLRSQGIDPESVVPSARHTDTRPEADRDAGYQAGVEEAQAAEAERTKQTEQTERDTVGQDEQAVRDKLRAEELRAAGLDPDEQ